MCKSACFFCASSFTIIFGLCIFLFGLFSCETYRVRIAYQNRREDFLQAYLAPFSSPRYFPRSYKTNARHLEQQIKLISDPVFMEELYKFFEENKMSWSKPPLSGKQYAKQARNFWVSAERMLKIANEAAKSDLMANWTELVKEISQLDETLVELVLVYDAEPIVYTHIAQECRRLLNSCLDRPDCWWRTLREQFEFEDSIGLREDWENLTDRFSLLVQMSSNVTRIVREEWEATSPEVKFENNSRFLVACIIFFASFVTFFSTCMKWQGGAFHLWLLLFPIGGAVYGYGFLDHYITIGFILFNAFICYLYRDLDDDGFCTITVYFLAGILSAMILFDSYDDSDFYINEDSYTSAQSATTTGVNATLAKSFAQF